MVLTDRQEEELKLQLDALKEQSDMEGRKWHLTPIMEALYKQKIYTDPNKAALKYNVNASDKVMKTIQYCVAHDEYFVAEIVGVPGSGKSLVALELSVEIRVPWYNQLKEDCKQGKLDDFYMPVVYITSSVEETQAIFKKARKGDVIIQDEDPDASGSGAKTLLKNIKNILSICRELCVNFLFVSPDMADYLGSLVTLRLESMSKDYKRRITRTALYTPNNIALGYAYIKILPVNDKLMIRYHKRKSANIKKIREAGGGFSATFNEKDIIDYAEKIANYFVERYGIVEAVSMSISRIKDVCRWSIKGKTTKDQESVAYYAREILEDLFKTYEVEDVEEHEDGEYKATLIDDVENLELLESILAHAKPKTLQEKLGVAFFEEYYINGTNQAPATDKINEDFDTTYDRTSFLNTHFPAFQKGIMGACVEKAIHETYYPDCKLRAGQGEPDIDCKDYIVEIKARHERDKRRPLSLIKDEAYLDKYLKKNHPIRLVVVSYGKKRCSIKTYKLEYIEDNS